MREKKSNKKWKQKISLMMRGNSEEDEDDVILELEVHISVNQNFGVQMVGRWPGGTGINLNANGSQVGK